MSTGNDAVEHPDPSTRHVTRPAGQMLGQTPQRVQGPSACARLNETSAMPMPAAVSDGEEWGIPTMLQGTVGQSNPANDLQLSVTPFINAEGTEAQTADDWLNDIANEFDTTWLFGPPDDDPSPLTSMVTDGNTAEGRLFEGCRCPEHREIYRHWPAREAELTIAQCMRVCMYCGKDFPQATELRKHLRKPQYSRRNLTVVIEKRNRWGAVTPGWTHRQQSATPGAQSEDRRIRTRSYTDRTDATSPQC